MMAGQQPLTADTPSSREGQEPGEHRPQPGAAGGCIPSGPDAGRVAPPAAAFRYGPAALETSGGEEALQQRVSYSESFPLDVDLRNGIREPIINSLCSC